MRILGRVFTNPLWIIGILVTIIVACGGEDPTATSAPAPAGAANNRARCIGANNGPCRSSASPALGSATNRDSDGFPPHGYSHRWWRSAGRHEHSCTHAYTGSGAGGTAQGQPGNRSYACVAGNQPNMGRPLVAIAANTYRSRIRCYGMTPPPVLPGPVWR